MTMDKKSARKELEPWIHLQTIEAHQAAAQKMAGKARYDSRAYLDAIPPGSQG